MFPAHIFEYQLLDSCLLSNLIAEIIKIQEKCNLSIWTADNYRDEFIRNDSKQIIVLNKKNIIGFAIMRLIISNKTNAYDSTELFFNEAEILQIAVDPAFQRRGVGKNLLKKIIEVGVSFGIKAIWLEVRVSNHKAINFYRKNNFYHIYTRTNYYRNPSENAWIMQRNSEKC